MTCRASAKFANQCTSKHSARRVPMNDSTCALSVGFPGLEKSSVQKNGSCIHSLAVELR
jgi:hypothetical protein